jgi:hypothetical protein
VQRRRRVTRTWTARTATALTAAVVAVACSSAQQPSATRPPQADQPGTTPTQTTLPPAAPSTDEASTTGDAAVPSDPPVVLIPPPEPSTAAIPPPAWIGTRVLPRRPDGFGERQPTPPKLRNRRFITTDLLPPPPDGRWRATVRPVPGDVVRRSTWHRGCPVDLDDLVYITMTFWGFDDRPHTGEMVVNATVADDVVKVFRRMYRARFPIEEMRVRRAGEIDLPPTGDGNNTESFDCRNATLRGSWSNHAYGLAIDINPFHNPYRKGDLVVPELAEAYLDRGRHRPGMIQPGDVVTRAFDDIGWGWGGRWTSLDDWQHFSVNGR